MAVPKVPKTSLNPFGEKKAGLLFSYLPDKAINYADEVLRKFDTPRTRNAATNGRTPTVTVLGQGAAPKQPTPEELYLQRKAGIKPIITTPLRVLDPSALSYPGNPPGAEVGDEALRRAESPYRAGLPMMSLLSSLIGGAGMGISNSADIIRESEKQGLIAQKRADDIAKENWLNQLQLSNLKDTNYLRGLDIENDSINAQNAADARRYGTEVQEATDAYVQDTRTFGDREKQRLSQVGGILRSIIENKRFNADDPESRRQIIHALTSNGLTVSDLFNPNTSWMLGMSPTDTATLANRLTIAREGNATRRDIARENNATRLETVKIQQQGLNHRQTQYLENQKELIRLNGDQRARIEDLKTHARINGLGDQFKELSSLMTSSRQLERSLASSKERYFKAAKAISDMAKEPNNRGSNQYALDILSGLNERAASSAMTFIRIMDEETASQTAVDRKMSEIGNRISAIQQSIVQQRSLNSQTKDRAKANQPGVTVPAGGTAPRVVNVPPNYTGKPGYVGPNVNTQKKATPAPRVTPAPSRGKRGGPVGTKSNPIRVGDFEIYGE